VVFLRLVELRSRVPTNGRVTAISRIITQEGVRGIRVHPGGFIGGEEFAVVSVAALLHDHVDHAAESAAVLGFDPKS